MFSYHLPFTTNAVSYINSDGEVKFSPPVYEQRYATAIQILEDERWKGEIKKVVDFGCAEMRMLTLLRRIDGIEHIMEVDTDSTILQLYKKRADPLISDHLQKREIPLRVEILQGSIDSSVDFLRNVDAVIGIEIIEHLFPDVLENVPFNIFGFVQPKLAIFSTPNSDFNVLFQPLENGFRHLDHKFEWSRQQFKGWALNICKRFPNYRVSILGVGKAPPDYSKIGCVSQLAVFVRNDILNKPLASEVVPIPADTRAEKQYREIHSVDFPVYKDERSLEEKIRDNAMYQINRCRNIDHYFNQERSIYQIPISTLMEFVSSIGGTEEQLKAILVKEKHLLEGDFIVLPEFDDDISYESDRFSDIVDDCNRSEFSLNNEEEQWD